MRILILGGTAWLGRALTSAALADDHEVTCLARGVDADPRATLIRADRDQPGAYDRVAGRPWDIVIDVARQPGNVRGAVAALRDEATHYVFISTVSVYAPSDEEDRDESATLLPAFTGDYTESLLEYGEAKVACEEAVLAGFGADRSLIIRPGLIGGPGDPTGRTTYWPWRFAHPAHESGIVLTPDSSKQPTSVIDVRDLAEWTIRAAVAGTTGIFNATGESVPLGVHLGAARDVAEHAGMVLAASSEWLLAHDVSPWAGPRSMPLWVGDPAAAGAHSFSSERALEAGLEMRELSETLRDGLAGREAEYPIRPAGLSDDDERELIVELVAGER